MTAAVHCEMLSTDLETAREMAQLCECPKHECIVTVQLDATEAGKLQLAADLGELAAQLWLDGKFDMP